MISKIEFTDCVLVALIKHSLDVGAYRRHEVERDGPLKVNCTKTLRLSNPRCQDE
jgi:hypothetical protein